MSFSFHPVKHLRLASSSPISSDSSIEASLPILNLFSRESVLLSYKTLTSPSLTSLLLGSREFAHSSVNWNPSGPRRHASTLPRRPRACYLLPRLRPYNRTNPNPNPQTYRLACPAPASTFRYPPCPESAVACPAPAAFPARDPHANLVLPVEELILGFHQSELRKSGVVKATMSSTLPYGTLS